MNKNQSDSILQEITALRGQKQSEYPIDNEKSQ